MGMLKRLYRRRFHHLFSDSLSEDELNEILDRFVRSERQAFWLLFGPYWDLIFRSDKFAVQYDILSKMIQRRLSEQEAELQKTADSGENRSPNRKRCNH